MKYEKIELFGKQKSRGTFDDFYSTEKYNSLQEAYDANDFVICDFVKDEEGILYIEAMNVKNTDIKKYHRLIIQQPFAGLDSQDDYIVCKIACELFDDVKLNEVVELGGESKYSKEEIKEMMKDATIINDKFDLNFGELKTATWDAENKVWVLNN